jgi:hypothetical protein
MKKIYKGIIEGNLIRLKENIDLPMGSEAIITLKSIDKEERQEIVNRQMALLEKGFHLGKKLYTRRDDLYVR